MFLEWSLITILSILSLFLFLQVLFYKNLVEREEKGIKAMKMTLREAETLIRKYQVQLQRSLGNVDLMTSEMMSIKNDLKGVKQSHATLKFEKKRLEEELIALQNKIEALT
ncbi:MAG TPA: hypothetical protein EYO61_00100 [Campylobacterales bacterium]|nr:hypothetical protein [Campylobacterales bacterium]HIO71019.1 hypothetical protein [Campylobacterales bacterium]